MSCRSCDLRRIYRLFEEKKKAQQFKAAQEATAVVEEIKPQPTKTKKKKAVQNEVEVQEEVKKDEVSEDAE